MCSVVSVTIYPFNNYTRVCTIYNVFKKLLSRHLRFLAPRAVVRGRPNASHGASPLSFCMSMRILLILSSKPAIGVR